MIPLNIPIFPRFYFVQLTLAGQNLVEYHPGHPGAVDHGGMVIVLDDVVEVLVHQDDDILAVGVWTMPPSLRQAFMLPLLLATQMSSGSPVSSQSR